jgi:mono/diheme cytochrome c family protein
MKTPLLVVLFLSAMLIAPLSVFAQDMAPAAPPVTPPAATKVDYATQVKPIFENYCYQCHGNGRSKAGVRLDVKTSAMMHITAGDPMHSDVFRSMTRSMGASDHMPPVSQKQPGDADIATIKLWIQQGANWPDAPAK